MLITFFSALLIKKIVARACACACVRIHLIDTSAIKVSNTNQSTNL